MIRICIFWKYRSFVTSSFKLFDRHEKNYSPSFHASFTSNWGVNIHDIDQLVINKLLDTQTDEFTPVT